MTEKLRDRPFASHLLSRTIRKVGRLKFNANQFTEDQWDQFSGKIRTAAALYVICDMADADETFKISDMWGWLQSNWRSVRDAINMAPDADLSAPELFYNMAPQGRGRKARRAMPPRYNTLPDFVADKEVTLKQIEDEKKPPRPVSFGTSRQVSKVAKPLGTKKDLDATTL